MLDVLIFTLSEPFEVLKRFSGSVIVLLTLALVSLVLKGLVWTVLVVALSYTAFSVLFVFALYRYSASRRHT